MVPRSESCMGSLNSGALSPTRRNINVSCTARKNAGEASGKSPAQKRSQRRMNEVRNEEIMVQIRTCKHFKEQILQRSNSRQKRRNGQPLAHPREACRKGGR